MHDAGLDRGLWDPADQIGRNLDAVEFRQVTVDLAHRNAARVQ